MLTLAIDTSEEHCSVALREGSNLLSSRSEHIGRGHAERLLPLIDEQLEACIKSYSDITCIAVVRGPGTFTGLRIGLSVARGLALTLNVPCVGCSGLVALAAAESGAADPVHAVIKGRAGQAFHQAFDVSNVGSPVALTDAGGFDAQDVAKLIADQPGRLVGSGYDLIAPHLGHVADHQPRGAKVDHIDPGVVAELAQALKPDTDPPEPLYLRAADAKKKKAEFTIAGVDPHIQALQ